MNRLNWIMYLIQVLLPGAIILTERKIIALKGRCWMCGYSREGLELFERCPECGAESREPS